MVFSGFQVTPGLVVPSDVHITGRKHTFLGMDNDFIGGKKVALTMPHHVEEALEDFGKTLKRKVVNPETSKMFTIANETKELYGKKK